MVAGMGRVVVIASGRGGCWLAVLGARRAACILVQMEPMQTRRQAMQGWRKHQPVRGLRDRNLTHVGTGPRAVNQGQFDDLRRHDRLRQQRDEKYRSGGFHGYFLISWVFLGVRKTSLPLNDRQLNPRQWLSVRPCLREGLLLQFHMPA